MNVKPGQIYWNAKLSSYAVIYELTEERIKSVVIGCSSPARVTCYATWKKVPSNWRLHKDVKNT
jgi:hypothetical protein